jgi:hydroxymethylglutaryl-CoA reductase (NADPH)
MRITREAGGVTTTVIDDAMQRAPVFVIRDARAARDFGHWVDESFVAIKAKAEETTRFGKLRDIEQYALGRMRWLRFNFTRGDAAGQNMVTKAVYEGAGGSSTSTLTGSRTSSLPPWLSARFSFCGT